MFCYDLVQAPALPTLESGLFSFLFRCDDVSSDESKSAGRERKPKDPGAPPPWTGPTLSSCSASWTVGRPAPAPPRVVKGKCPVVQGHGSRPSRPPAASSIIWILGYFIPSRICQGLAPLPKPVPKPPTPTPSSPATVPFPRVILSPEATTPLKPVLGDSFPCLTTMAQGPEEGSACSSCTLSNTVS